MDLVTKLPTGTHGYDAICVIVDRLSKMVHFVPCKESMNAMAFTRLFINNVFRYKRHADTGLKDVEFEVGAQVLLSTRNLRIKTGKVRKFVPRYVGPFVVEAKINANAYRLTLPATMSRLHPVFHVSLLKKYSGSDVGIMPPPVEWMDETPVYYVERLLDHRYVRAGKAGEFLVQWEGYDASFNTWEPRANLTGCDKLLAEYNAIHCLKGKDQQRGRVVLVDEHRTTRVSSAVNGQQPCERQLNKRRATRPADWKPPAGQVEHRLVRPAWSQQRDQPVRGLMWCSVVAPHKPPQAPRSSQEASQAAASEPGPSTPLPAKRSKRTEAEQAAGPTQPTKAQGKAAKAKPAPQPGRWLDRDCNAALNMQRIGEGKWRPLELCYWPEQGKLPAKGKEYPGLGYKRLRDKPPRPSSSSLLWHSSVWPPPHLKLSSAYA
ncbi:hypothetical protein QJQ45_025619 [Haematococcus lacustris]|nr:hypothetical protein QJQ45_025619 [Haematococcus lacustris]